MEPQTQPAGLALGFLRGRSPSRRESAPWSGAWGVFLLIWFGVGLVQIADGLL